MKKILFVATAILMATGFSSAQADHIWINELHYDNTGGDTNEFVEIAFRSGSLTSIADYNLELYNGSGGAVYNTLDLATAVQGLTLPIANDSRTVTFWRVNTLGIQNGSPDGLALSLKSDSSLVGQFLSYEGTFTATSGPATGILSTDLGVSEGGQSDQFSLGLTGTGLAAADFTWSVTPFTSLSGQSTVNTGQTLAAAAIPEPTSAALLGLGLIGLVSRRRRK